VTSDLPVFLVQILFQFVNIYPETTYAVDTLDRICSSAFWDHLELVTNLSRTVQEHGDSSLRKLVLTEQDALSVFSKILTPEDYSRIRSWIHRVRMPLQQAARNHDESQPKQSSSRWRKFGKSSSAPPFRFRAQLDTIEYLVRVFQVRTFPAMSYTL